MIWYIFLKRKIYLYKWNNFKKKLIFHNFSKISINIKISKLFNKPSNEFFNLKKDETNC